MPPQVQDDVDEYLKRYTQKKVREEAQKQGVPVDYAERQAKAESAFRPDVITGRKQSSAGAIGAMQLMPGTAKDLGVNPYHIDQNIEGGVRYSKQMLDRYKGDQQKAAAAYNWGPGNVDRKGLANAPAETRAYQQKVAGTQGDDVDEFLSRWKEQPATKKEQLRPPFQSPIDMRLNAPNEAQKAYDRAAAAVQPAPQTPAPRPKQTLGQMRQQARTFQPVTQEDILRNPITPEERKASVESFIAKNEREKKLQQAAAKAKLEEEASRASQSTLGRMGTRFARGAVRGITQTPFEFVQMVNPDPVVQQTMKRIADDSKEWQSQNLPVDNRNPATLNVFKPEFYSLENVGKAATENIPEVLGEMLPQMALARGAGGVARLAAPELAAATVPRMASTTGAQLAARTAAGGYGAAQLSTQAYQKALDAGMTPEQAARAAAIEAPIGFSEFLGSPGTTGFTRPGTTIRREMREEGLQELGQTAASGLAGKYASGYDANKPLVDIAGESIGGGLLGAATGGIVATPGARLQAYRQGQQQRATRSAIDQRSAANAAAIASQPVQAQPVTEPLTEPLAAQPQPSAPATPQAQPQGFPRLPEPENFNARRAKLLGMPTPAEVGINEQIQAAAQLLDSQNEGDQRQAKRMLNKALSDLRKSEGYLAEAQLPPDAPRPFTAVRDAIEARLKPAPKVKETPASQVPSSPAVEAGQPTASNALRAEADAAKIKAAEFEQVGDFTQAAATYQAAHTNLKRLRRSMGMPKTPEAVAQINQIDREISIADANRRKALQQARTAQRQANAPTKDLAIPATFSRPKSAQVQAQQQDARNISSDISAPLLRPDAVQNPEGGIPQMPEPTFTDRLEAAARRDASARGKAKPAKRLLSRIAELGGISDRYAGELQDVKDARRIGVIRQKAEMSPDVLARQLQSEGYDVDPEDLNTLWEAARRDIAGRDERTSQTSELERRLAEEEAAYNERQPFDQIVADVDATLPPTERELPTQPEPQERLAVTKQNAPLAPPRAAQDYRGLLESPRTPQDVKARKRAIAALMPFNIQGNKSELLAKGLDQFVDVAAKSSKRVIDAFGGAGTYTHYLRSKGLGREGDVLNEYDPLRYITHKQIKENPQAVGEAARRTVEDLKRLTDTIQEGTSFTEEHANIRRQVTEYFRRRLMNLTQPGQRMTGKIRTGEPVEMQDSPELAGLYTVLQNQAFNFLPVQAEVGKKGFKLPGFAVVGNIGGKVRVFVKGRNLILNAPANIAEAGKRFQGLNVRRGDGWELIRKDAGDGDFVPVDTSYLNKEGQETTNYSKLTQEDAVPEVYVQKVQENLLPAWERGAKLLITNNWDENVASYLSSQGFRVFKDYRQGASKNERAAGGAAELIAINFDERTGQVFRRGGNALSGELARRTGQATEQRGSTLTRQGRPEELATGTQEQTTPLRGRGNASRPLAASGFQPDTADLREVREFAKREPQAEQFTEEPPTAPLARRRQPIRPPAPASPRPVGNRPLSVDVAGTRTPTAMSPDFPRARREMIKQGREVEARLTEGQDKGVFGNVAEAMFKSNTPDVLHGQDSFFHDPDVKGKLGLTRDAEMADVRRELKTQLARSLGLSADEVSLSHIKPEVWRAWAKQKGLGREAVRKLEAGIARAERKQRATETNAAIVAEESQRAQSEVRQPAAKAARPAKSIDAQIKDIRDLQKFGLIDDKEAKRQIAALEAQRPKIAERREAQPKTRADVENSPEFKRWFGDSVVTENGKPGGKPLVVYHGTDKDIEAFQDRVGRHGQFFGKGHYFAVQPSGAESFAYGEGANIVPSYLSIKNPLTVTTGTSEFRQAFALEDPAAITNTARGKGHDGIIIVSSRTGKPSEIIAFSPNQIKSAIGNRGTFDPNSAKITERREAPGFFSQLERVIDAKMPAKASAAQVRAIIENPQSGVKPEEVKWTGLDDYLRGKETVTKADVQEFLKANQVDVREVESGKKAYAQYTLPGAKEDSYRELLLTLPRKGSEVRRLGIDEWTIDGRPATREEALATSVERGYQSSHFDEPNILAHIRFNERTDADGKRVLHIEEIQSDWHQEGRKKGYAQKFTELPDGYEARETFPQSGRYRVYRRDGAPIGSEATTREGAIANALPVLSERSGVPDAPFKKTWHELAFKRALRWAAENGYERMTWTTGEQQAERFDLSKQVSRVQWNKTRENLTAYNLDGERVITESGVTSQKLEDYVGKEVAAKLANEPSRTFEDRGDTWHELSGLDLKVGGEGMKGFYDQILPAFANKYGRKWGVKVGTAQVEVEGKSANSEIPDVENALIEQRRGKKYRIKTDPELRQQMNLMAAKLRADSEALPAFQSLPDDQKAKIRQTYTDTPEYVYFSDRGEAKKFSDETGLPIESLTDLRLEKTNTAAVHSIDITPAMRESVMQGQPKFRREVSGAMPERYTGRQLFENARLTFRPARNRPATLVANDWGGAMLNQLLNDTFGITTTDANFTIAAKDAKDLRDYLADAKDSGTYEPAQVANMGAMLKQMDAAIADAEANQQDVAFVTRRPAEPISATKAKIRHETVHLSQSRIAADLSALTGKNWLDSQPNAADIHKELNRRGYAPETHDYEAAAFVASGDYGVFGMNLDQAAKFLSDYFGAVVQKHGKRALQKFGAIDPKLQPVLEAARRETGTTRSSTDGRTNETAPGTPRRIGAADEARGGRASVLARRREGDTGTAGEAGRSPRTRASIENSPEFKRWFSDSKVVDESGKPLVVYHGSPAKTPITEFAKEKANPRDTVSGFYFTEAPEVASEIYAVHGNQVNEKNPAKPENAGATYPVYISLKNPIDLNHYDEATREKLIAATDRVLGEGAGLGLQLYLDRYGNNDNAPHTLVHYLRLSAKPGGFLQKQKAHLGILATRILKAAGYDGATYIGENDAGSGNKNKHRAWIAFEPSQIKSAIGNRGTFDPSSPRITERKERPRFSFGRIPEGQGQVLASGFNVQGLFGRAPKEAKDGKPVPLPRNFNLADWSQKLYRDAMAAGLPKDARAKYDAAKTVREKNVILMESKLDSAREAKIFDLIDRAQAAAEKNDGSALYDVLSDATDLMRKTPSERGLKRVGQELGNAVSLPRAIMASMDVSAPLRQGAILTLPPSQWGKAAKATVRMFQSFSTAKYKEIGKQINLHEDAEIARESGLYLSTDKSGLLTKKEEDFISGWADKIPLVKHSEQAYKTYLDSLRMDSFARYKKSIDKTKGLSEEQKQKAYQAAAEWINTATGRGSLGSHFESAMPTLSKVLFAPRYVASRIQVLNPYTYAKNARTPEGRAVLKNQMSDMVQYAGMVSLTLALASAAGATVGLDPEDPDFLKIKVGQTRYDVLAGLQQPMRLFYRLGAAVSDRLKGEKPERNQSVGDISKKYVRSKLAPVPSFLWDYFEAKDFIGRDFEMKRAVLDRVTPLMWKDMADAYEKEGGAGAAKILPAAFGIGVQNYGERTGATKESRFTKEAEGRGLKYDFVRPKVGEPEAVYKQRVQRVEGWMSEYGDKLLSHPSYSLLTESQKQAAIENLRRRIGTQQNVREPKRDLFGNIESFAPEKVIQSVLKSEATRPKREAGKLWSPPANRP